MVPGPPHDLRDVFIASSRRLVVALAAVTGSVEEAEDCVAEAFARAAARWEQLQVYEDPEGWVRRVALNIARSRWRHARRSLPRTVDPTSVGLSEDHVAVLTALRQLPRPQREAVALHYLLDLRIEEIARVQRVSPGTVKARLARGRKSLATLLAVEDSEVSRQ
jgi:RNA polymerase sigma-70 factor (ECF subfamily)